MASARFAWGIDIGNRALKAVKLVREGDQLKVDDFELIEHEHVLSNAGDNKESLIQTALANFVQRHPMKGGVVSVGVSGQSSFARFIKLPPVEPKKIPEIVRFEAIQQIPFPLDDVEWSYQLFQNPESPDVEVGIFAMRKELINHHIKYFTDVDMNVQVVQMNPLAVYNAVYYDQRLQGTTMLIDLGAENTDLIICDNDTVWMRSIPIGGNNFTETLVKGFKLPFAKAEDLKRNAATSKYARQIFQAMRPVFADLVAEIQRSVGFYASVHRDSRIKKIIALGGTFRLPGLQKYLQQNLSLDVERLDNIAAGTPSDPKQAATFNENILSVIGAYGLAVQAMGEGKITSSLLPQSIRREKLWREKVPLFASAAALFCIGTGIALGGYFLQNWKYESAATDRNNIKQTSDLASKLDGQWSQIESSGAGDRAQIANILGLQEYRDLWRHLLRDVQSAVPKPQAQVLQGLIESKPDLIKQIPRPQREQIVINSITSRYVPAIGPMVAANDQDFRRYVDMVGQASGPTIRAAVAPRMNSGGGFAQPGSGPGFLGGPPPEFFAQMQRQQPTATPDQAAAGQSDQRGFLIAIKGTSPNANAGSLIESKFCDALKKIGPTAENQKIEYAVVKAVTVSANLIRDDQTRLQQMKQEYDAAMAAKDRGVSMTPGGGGEFAGPTGGGAQFRPPTAQNMNMNPNIAINPVPAANPNTPDESAPYQDHLLGEDIRNDWEFTVLIAVVLDPKPPAQAAAQ
ncbi:MAG TPA: type IV pilus assembly protein PilM [Tepidisphaeraceae bacterium]|nr:type IV pilus assembly protein PilM [Tepidisphaeraceae bacterium]